MDEIDGAIIDDITNNINARSLPEVPQSTSRTMTLMDIL